MPVKGCLINVIVFLVTLSTLLPAFGQPADRTELQVAYPILPLDRVRIGMKGYGKTVFQGIRIESFPVEVVSVMADFGPQRGAIWIRCTGPRMQRIGAVQGMSGSPIYLWSPDEPQVIGRGGRLIGAFAFGFTFSKDCYVGVQPIELMRQVADRANKPTQEEARSITARHGGIWADQSLATALSIAKSSGLGSHQTWRMSLLRRLAQWSGEISAPDPQPSLPTVQLADGLRAAPRQLTLPVSLRSPALARALSPLFEPMGMTPISLASAMAGQPPAWIDPESVKLEAGSIVSIPLAYGDLDFSAIGTVTEVLPGGKVLALGHPLEGLGTSSLPMASGYVHFVLPRLSSSFKYGGTVKIQGALVRDEASAVAGRYDTVSADAPVVVTVSLPNRETKKYQYRVVEHQTMGPLLAATVIGESIGAEQGLPPDNTIQWRGKIGFDGGRVLEVNNIVPQGSSLAVMLYLYAPMLLMGNNPHQNVFIESVYMDVTVADEVKLATFNAVRIDKLEVAPGEKLGVTIRLLQYAGKLFEKRIEFSVPRDMPDGEYELIVCDAQTYANLYFTNRPHLAATTTVDELFDVIKQMMGVRSDALYLLMNLPDQHLAVGRTEMPKLPSSRRAMIATTANTLATPYQDWVAQKVPMDVVPIGNVKFKITVDQMLAEQF